MKERNFKLAKSLSVAMLLLGSNLALAETLSVPASVTVNNAIDFTFTGTLNFGTVRATASSVANDCRVLTLPANPVSPLAAVTTYPILTSDFTAECTVATPTAALAAVGGTPARPIFTLQGLAPFSSMKLKLPTGTLVDLVGSLPPGSAKFHIGDFTAWKTTTPAAAITLTAGAGSIQTDSTGKATFTVGASLSTDSTVITGQNYQDAIAYTGNFDVIVTY